MEVETKAREVICLVEAAGVTDRGLVRKENQDAFVVDAAARLLLVADGMGGCGGGAVAAAMVASAVPDEISKLEGTKCLEDTARLLPDLLHTISERVRLTAQDRPDLVSMGAALVFALVDDARALVVNMGDSRAYRIRGRCIERLTRDHTVAAALVEANEIDEAAAAAHPLRNALARYVGMSGRADPDILIIDIAAGDWLLLCSDGLACVDADTLCEVVGSTESAAEACAKMVAAANDAGGGDNTTAVLARFGSTP